MKKLFLLLSKKAVRRSVSIRVPEGEPDRNSKKEVWKFVIQTVINILAAVLTALGATSCVMANY